MDSKIAKKKKKNKYINKFHQRFKYIKYNERKDSIILYFYEMKYKLITIIFLIFFLVIMISSHIFQRIIINEKWEGKANNEGFLKIHTIHKSKYTNYNYKENIIVYKDILDKIISEAIEIMEKHGEKGEFLKELAVYIKERNK